MKTRFRVLALLVAMLPTVLSLPILASPAHSGEAYGVESQGKSTTLPPIELTDGVGIDGLDAPTTDTLNQLPVETGSDGGGISEENPKSPLPDESGDDPVVASAMSDDSLENASDIADLISDPEEPPSANASSRYFYNQLDDVERAFYRKVASATLDMPSFTVRGLSAEQAGKLIGGGGGRWLSAILADSPRYHMMWERYCDVSGSEEEGVVTVTLRRMLCATDYTIAKSEARIRQIVANVGDEPDPYVRYRKLATYLTRDMEYDGGYVFASGVVSCLNDCAAGALTRGSAVCAGFADLLKILCDELDIPCVIIGNAGHAWNLVEMGGFWYHTDASDYVKCDEDGDSLSEISQHLEDLGVLLFGTGSGRYLGEESYFISDPFLAQTDDFTFPEASAGEKYEYQGVYDVVYEEHDLDFEETAVELTYTANDDGATCTVTGFVGGAGGSLSIPSELDGLVVTGIGEGAFGGSGFEGELELADSIKRIGSSAFIGCTGITSVRWPSALEEIGMSAFNGCTGLVGGLALPEGLVRIEDDAFYGCAGITGPVTLPEGLEYLGWQAFWQCTSLGGTMRIPDHAEVGLALANYSRVEGFEVGDGCDRYATVDGMLFDKEMTTLLLCPAAKPGDLEVPEGVTEIANFACQGCGGFDGELKLPATLKTIGNSAFRDCAFTGDLLIPDGVESVGDLAFFCAYDVDRSGELTLPDSLGSVGEHSFDGNGFEGDLRIPRRLKELPEYCFGDNRFDGALELPDGLSSIGPFCFYGGSFTNAVDLSGSSVALSESAFAGTQFAGFSCNCEAGTSDSETEDGLRVWCNNCGGAYIAPQISPRITAQPGDVRAQDLERVTLSVGAEGEGLAYQWQYHYRGGSRWADWGTGASVTKTARASWDGLVYRCVVTDAFGATATSEEGTLWVGDPVPLAITAQPGDVRAQDLERVTLSVGAEGEGLAYQWQYHYRGGSRWADWGTGASVTKTARASWDGLVYRCVVTDAFGATATSDEGTLRVTRVYALPSQLILTDQGIVSMSIAEPKAHAVMLGVYREDTPQLATRAMKRMMLMAQAPNAVLKATIPVDVPAACATPVSVNVSNLFDESGSYYIVAKSVESQYDKDAPNFAVGDTIACDPIYYSRPEDSLNVPSNIAWSESTYGRATWDSVVGAASYQVMLFSGENIVASRNVDTTHCDFGGQLLGVGGTENRGYAFTVTAMSSDVLSLSNSAQSERSDLLCKLT